MNILASFVLGLLAFLAVDLWAAKKAEVSGFDILVAGIESGDVGVNGKRYSCEVVERKR